MPTQSSAELVAEAITFFGDREGAESENRQWMLDDLRFAFVPGAQWDANALQKRQGKPCYSYNRIAGGINQIVGEQRIMQPSCKVRAINRAASVKTAEMFGGMIRDIEARSNARSIYAEAFKYEVAGSWGAWRVVPEYEDDSTFNQVLRVKRIPNPLTVYFDEEADPFGRGAMRCVVAERISKDKYKMLFGDKAATNLPTPRDSRGWVTDTEVRIGEYYKMVAETQTLALLSDGRVMPYSRALDTELKALGGSITIVQKRKALKWFCEWYKIDGGTVLEGPVRYPYSQIPVVRAPGRFVNIEGKQYFQSLHRHSKDAQRTYNYDRSSMVEMTALTPRAPWVGTAKHFAGYENDWAQSNVSNAPFLRYNIDEASPEAKPTRNPGPEVPQAYMALAAHDSEDIRQTMGYFNPALDQQTAAGDAESGRALRTRLMTSDSGSFEFLDNFAQAVQYTWQILVDIIPVHYDTARTVRILGLDERAGFAELDPEAFKNGKYDVTTTLGPAYATQRMESLETLLEAAQQVPIIGEIAPDLIAQNIDATGVDEIVKRIRVRLIGQGVMAPTEEDMVALEEIPQAPPDPVQEQLARRLAAQATRDEASATKTNAEAATVAASAETATRRELLELREKFEEVRKMQAETALLLKELRAPTQPTVI